MPQTYHGPPAPGTGRGSPGRPGGVDHVRGAAVMVIGSTWNGCEVSIPICQDPEMRASLGFYVLDKLTADERVAVERHLAECDYCRAEHEELDGVVPSLGLLGQDDIRDLIAQCATPALAGREPAPVEAESGVTPQRWRLWLAMVMVVLAAALALWSALSQLLS